VNYEEFKAEYTAAFLRAAKYTAGQIGFSINVERMAELADAYPEFEERVLEEAE
jgi:hypothetical protein